MFDIKIYCATCPDNPEMIIVKENNNKLRGICPKFNFHAVRLSVTNDEIEELEFG